MVGLGHGGAHTMQCVRVRLARGQVATVAPDAIGDARTASGKRFPVPTAMGDR
jgi:hypothetical protein